MTTIYITIHKLSRVCVYVLILFTSVPREHFIYLTFDLISTFACHDVFAVAPCQPASGEEFITSQHAPLARELPLARR